MRKNRPQQLPITCIPKNEMWWDYMMAAIFIFTSDAVFWHGGLTPAISMLFFFFMSFITFIKKKARLNNTISVCVISVFFIISNAIVYQSGYKDNSTLGYIVTTIASFLFCASYNFYYFRKLITDVVYVICLIAVPLFIVFSMEKLPISSKVIGSTDYLVFGPFIYGWTSPLYRFSGIWHEPGACQIILNMILWLHLDNFKKWQWEKGQLKKIILILIALIFTKSTGGYMSVMLLGAAVVYDMKLSSKYRVLIYPTVFIIMIVALFFMFNSDVIQNKLFNDDDTNESKIVRMADINALLTMSIDRPLLGYGLGTTEFFRMSDLYGNITSSSGILKFAACFGWLWMVIILSYVWKGMRQIYNFKSSFFVFGAFIMMMFNEDFMEFPISNVFLFMFASYKNSSFKQAKKKRIKKNSTTNTSY